MTRRARSRLTAAEQQRIRELAAGDMPYHEIAALIGVHARTVEVWARKLGIHRGRGHHSRFDLPYAAVVAYTDPSLKLSAAEIAKQMGIKHHTVLAKLRAAGVAVRSTRESRKATLGEILQRRRAGQTLAQIADQVGLAVSTVKTRYYRWVRRRRLGRSAPSRSGPTA